MTRVALFFTPAIFVVAMGGAYFAGEPRHQIVCVAIAVGSLIGWYAAVGHFELSAWRAGRGGRSL